MPICQWLAASLKRYRNSGELASISAQVAYSNDMFDYQLGDDEQIIHKPLLGGERGTPIAVYCIAKTKTVLSIGRLCP